MYIVQCTVYNVLLTMIITEDIDWQSYNLKNPLANISNLSHKNQKSITISPDKSPEKSSFETPQKNSQRVSNPSSQNKPPYDKKNLENFENVSPNKFP